MRKTLLVVCALIMALSVSAQGVLSVKGLNRKVAEPMKTVRNLNVKSSDLVKLISVNELKALSLKAKAKAPAQSELVGAYVEEQVENGFKSYPTAGIVDYQGQVGMIFGEGLVSAVGTYNAATGKITVEPQVCYEDQTEGICVIFAFKNGANNYEEAMTFTVGDDGSITLDQDGYDVVIMNEASEYFGYYIYEATGTVLRPTNAVLSETEDVYDRSTGSYTKTPNQYDVLVEDNTTFVNVYGFGECGCLKIDVKGDGTVSAATGQNLRLTGFTGTDKINYGDYLLLAGYANNGVDYNATSISGTISSNVITLTDGYSICTKLSPSNDYRYWGLYTPGTTITLDEGNYASGIKDITASREEAIKNAKAYNIMGQRVDANNAKGLIIVNGKKYLKK